MGVKILKKTFSSLASHYYLRNDYKYNYVIKTINVNIQTLKLGHLFKIINGFSASTQDYTEEKTIYPFVRIGELSNQDGINEKKIIYLKEETQIAKYKILQEYDFILATIGATIGKVNCVTENIVGGTASNNTVILRPNKLCKELFMYDFLEFLLQSEYIQKQFFAYRSQKSQPNLQLYDIRNVIIPVVSKETQKNIKRNIKPIENSIKELKKQSRTTKEIINTILNIELNLNSAKLEALKNEKINYLSLYNFTNNKDLRCSCKFHSKSARFVMKELTSITCKKIKDFISEPIVLGESISPSDYDENGTYKYLSMASIKTWEFNEENAQSVSDLYFTNSIKKVQKDDIIIARSGEGTIGKVAIINNEVDAIFCDFTMRIRLKDYNPLFAYYYFRTDYFQELIYGYKKGLGNNTNIFPNQIQEFPIPDVSLEKQNEIVLKIKSEIDKQNEIENEIHNLRNTIHKIINESIM